MESMEVQGAKDKHNKCVQAGFIRWEIASLYIQT